MKGFHLKGEKFKYLLKYLFQFRTARRRREMTIAIMLVNGNLFVLLVDSCNKTMMMGWVMGDKNDSSIYLSLL